MSLPVCLGCSARVGPCPCPSRSQQPSCSQRGLQEPPACAQGMSASRGAQDAAWLCGAVLWSTNAGSPLCGCGPGTRWVAVQLRLLLGSLLHNVACCWPSTARHRLSALQQLLLLVHAAWVQAALRTHCPSQWSLSGSQWNHQTGWAQQEL